MILVPCVTSALDRHPAPLNANSVITLRLIGETNAFRWKSLDGVSREFAKNIAIREFSENVHMYMCIARYVIT